MPPAVMDRFACMIEYSKIRRERKIPGLVLTKVTLTKNSLENGQAALNIANGLRFGSGTRGSRVRFRL
jgi:hypothetical protein